MKAAKAKTKPKPETTLQPARSADPFRESARYELSAARGEMRAAGLDKAVMRLALLRRLSSVMDMPRGCRDLQCRRNRRCVGLTLRCQRDFPRTELSEESQAAAIADFRKLLTRELAKQGRGR